MKGDGSLYLRGGVYWGSYYRGKQRIRESLHTSDPEAAAKKLQQLRKAQERGTYLAPGERRIKVEELLEDLERDQDLRGLASASKAASHMKAVSLELGDLRATELDTATVQRVQKQWLEASVMPATVNRRCELLRQAFRLASRRTPAKVKAVPHIPLLRVENARQGFLPKADFDALIAELFDDDVRDFCDWFFWTGMRPNEIRQLTWSMLDRETWTLHLDPKADKNRRGRVIPVEGPLLEIMERRLDRRLLGCQLIFHRVSKGKAGRPIKDFRLQWKSALHAAKLSPGLRPYDLRRTAVRNMVRGGTDRSVAKKISGHQTDSTFERYDITSTADLSEAVARTAEYVAGLPKRRNVSEFGGAKASGTVRAQRGEGSKVGRRK